jgi:hypothetical protein
MEKTSGSSTYLTDKARPREPLDNRPETQNQSPVPAVSHTISNMIPHLNELGIGEALWAKPLRVKPLWTAAVTPFTLVPLNLAKFRGPKKWNGLWPV